MTPAFAACVLNINTESICWQFLAYAQVPAQGSESSRFSSSQLKGTIQHMSKKSKNKHDNDNIIARNKLASHDYFIEERYEAGIALEGWEVKSLREGRINLKESYVIVKDGEAFLFGAHVTPLPTASTHIKPDPIRTRKLLLNRKELNVLIGMIERKGYTLVPTFMYWKKGRAKLEIGLAKGKKQHDKRAANKDRDWKREKERLFKRG